MLTPQTIIVICFSIQAALVFTAFLKEGHRPGTFCNNGFQPVDYDPDTSKSVVGTTNIYINS